MIVKFNNIFLSNLYSGKLKGGKFKYNTTTIEKFKKTILTIESVENINELKQFRSLHFEALKKEYKGYFSIRVDLKYRLIVSIYTDIVEIKDIIFVEDLTNHYK